MYNSVARNNIVYNEAQGIFVSQSHNNQIYNNTISNSKNNAILIATGASGNTFTSNKISSLTPEGAKIVQDTTSKNNIFLNNQIIHPAVNTPTGLGS